MMSVHDMQSSTCISNNTFLSKLYLAYTVLNVYIGKPSLIIKIVFPLFISVIFLETVSLNGVVGDVLWHSSSFKLDCDIPVCKWIHYKYLFVYFIVL